LRIYKIFNVSIETREIAFDAFGKICNGQNWLEVFLVQDEKSLTFLMNRKESTEKDVALFGDFVRAAHWTDEPWMQTEDGAHRDEEYRWSGSFGG